MNKAELVEAVAKKSGLSMKDSKKAIDAIIESVTEALKGGDKVVLVGFGTFKTAQRAEREARNVRTGEKIKVPSKRVVKFKAGETLKKLVEKE